MPTTYNNVFSIEWTQNSEAVYTPVLPKVNITIAVNLRIGQTVIRSVGAPLDSYKIQHVEELLKQKWLTADLKGKNIIQNYGVGWIE